jgi:hypothetical protein
MLKQSSTRMKMVLAILLAVLFVTSLSAVAVEAHGGGPWGGYGWGRPWEGGWSYGPGCMWVGGNNWLCPSYSGMPYTIQNSTPASPAPAPEAQPNLAGVAIFPETTSTLTNSSSK